MRKTALLTILALHGCTTYGNHGLRPLRPLEIPTAPFVDVVTTSMTGSLMYEGGCLLLTDDDTKVRVLPVWPAGTVFNGTAVIFHTPGKADQPVLVTEELTAEGEPYGPAASPNLDRFRRLCGAEPFFVAAVRQAN